MNNIQQTRVQLEKTYQNMGGKELEEDAASILNQMQKRLNDVLDNLAKIFAVRYYVAINILYPKVFLFRYSFPITKRI